MSVKVITYTYTLHIHIKGIKTNSVISVYFTSGSGVVVDLGASLLWANPVHMRNSRYNCNVDPCMALNTTLLKKNSLFLYIKIFSLHYITPSVSTHTNRVKFGLLNVRSSSNKCFICQDIINTNLTCSSSLKHWQTVVTLSRRLF